MILIQFLHNMEELYQQPENKKVKMNKTACNKETITGFFKK